jgi:hypothetical protein
MRGYLSADTAVVARATAALVSISNRLAAAGTLSTHSNSSSGSAGVGLGTSGLVAVASKATQAAAAAELGRALLPWALLLPELVIRRLVTDAVTHR